MALFSDELFDVFEEKGDASRGKKRAREKPKAVPQEEEGGSKKIKVGDGTNGGAGVGTKEHAEEEEEEM